MRGMRPAAQPSAISPGDTRPSATSVASSPPAALSARPGGPVAAVRALARLARVVERAGGDLSLAHYRVLSAVAGGDDRASRIAVKLALGQPSLSGSVDALTRRGLLERETDAADQRAVSLRLTPAGARALEAAEAAMVTRLAELAGTDEELERLVDALTSVGVAIEARMAARFQEAATS